MKISKTKFIKKYGTKVIVRKFVSDSFREHSSFAILGRGSKTNSTMRLLQTLREGIFPADEDLDSGYFVENVTQNETYIVGGTLPEYGVNQTLSIVANLLVCNSFLTIKGQKKVADARGNLKTEFVTTCSDLPCHIQEATNELRQYDSGVLPETDYVIYSTSLDVMETDQVVLAVNGKSEAFKVLSKDYVTFPNMVVIQVSRDVRK
ncbi:hypothetical protein SECTIM467_29 [Brevibacillus phage SecTim467]|uniref:Uncharacterized protein n=2 Tax=Jenstvirus jenst TaxID=1982225 RepID=A0A0K2CPN0_9CAUD|nr:hypothetical protein AVV11_gp162 [Brevibacillus phage Jenst]ALA07159.1 hypothetical protein JENST_29 [Brevibacillus phage Jenst]ALA07529.1 hypothetical protein SECTIM467_29 [Brevibacillus phage SecTim467]